MNNNLFFSNNTSFDVYTVNIFEERSDFGLLLTEASGNQVLIDASDGVLLVYLI
jgi:hypothetical protein